MICRSFIPVGQGGFCVERFYDGNQEERGVIVYDCGTITTTKRINGKQVIKDEFGNNKQRIDAVFISHFHYDHISMLFQLIEKCDVKKIYLPYVRESNKEVLKIHLRLSNGSASPESKERIERFIDSPNDEVNRGNDEIIEVYYVLEYDNQALMSSSTDRNMIMSGTISANDVFENKVFSKWVFVTHNIREEKRAKEFLEAYFKCTGKELTPGEVKKIFKDEKEVERVRDAYRSVKGDLNTNSMVMYSGPNPLYDHRIVNCRMWECGNSCLHKFCDCCCCCKYVENSNNPKNDLAIGCLYLGDYDLKNNWDKIESRYKHYFHHVGCVQIPHHGSKHNYNKRILDMGNCSYYIILSGIKNPYGHPHPDVLESLLKSKHRGGVRVVTEIPQSRVDFCILYKL